MPFFSIIIPTFNSEKTLLNCLNSIIYQSHTDFEVIVQDGNSTDQTVPVAKSCQDNRINIFSEADKGVYDAMNKALKNVSGEWILFLGSDDLLFSNDVLEEVRKYCDHSEVKLWYGNVKIVGTNHWAEDKSVYRGETNIVDLLTHNYHHQSVFYNRSVFEKGKTFNIRYNVCADYDFNLYCTAHFKVRYFPVIVSSFYAGGVSTHRNDIHFENDKWHNIIRYYGSRLKSKEFKPFLKDIKKVCLQSLKKFDLRLWLLTFRIYCFIKFN